MTRLSHEAQAVHCPVCGVAALPKKYGPFFIPDPVYRVACSTVASMPAATRGTGLCGLNSKPPPPLNAAKPPTKR
jgi:hypothetical protein